MVDTALVDWLLEADTPSIRYLTLRDLLRRPAHDPEMRAAQDAIMTSGPVPAILAAQTDVGHWPGERSCYTPKYHATHWSLVLLTELAADPADPRVQCGVEYMLHSTAPQVQDTLADGNMRWFPCFWGNLLRYAAYAGRAADPRTAAIVRLLVQHVHAEQFRCSHNGGLPCAWGAARILWGLAALPVASRTPEVATAIEQGIALLLENDHLLGGTYPTSGRPHTFWSRLNFPLFYQVDVLFVLRVLRDLDVLDHPGAQSAREWLRNRRTANGRWGGASPYRRLTWDLGPSAETRRWVSLHAALVAGA